MVEAKAKDREHNFSKSCSANFPLFLSAKDCISLIFFDDNSKIVVSKRNECDFEVLRNSSNVEYVTQRHRGNEIIKAVTREWE